MSETKNDEQRASGALKPVGWLCHDCGVFREHDTKPMGCGVCESHASKAFGYPPQPGTGGNWQPLWGTDAIVSTAGFVATRAGFYGNVEMLAKDVFEMLTGFRDD